MDNLYGVMGIDPGGTSGVASGVFDLEAKTVEEAFNTGLFFRSYSVQGTGNQRTIAADVDWTFPLEFVEVVWGDGQKTGRQIISATDLPPFGKHRFQIPFNATGKKWVRFAVWDSAGEGAFVQPVKIERSAASTTAQR